jgi:hypothetical protein
MEFAGLPWDLIRTCDTPVQELEKSAALAAPKRFGSSSVNNGTQR